MQLPLSDVIRQLFHFADCTRAVELGFQDNGSHQREAAASVIRSTRLDQDGMEGMSN